MTDGLPTIASDARLPAPARRSVVAELHEFLRVRPADDLDQRLCLGRIELPDEHPSCSAIPPPAENRASHCQSSARAIANVSRQGTSSWKLLT